jgi:hypothetical protein
VDLVLKAAVAALEVIVEMVEGVPLKTAVHPAAAVVLAAVVVVVTCLVVVEAV